MQRGMRPSDKRSRATERLAGAHGDSIKLAKSHLDRAQAQVGELQVLLQGMSAAPAAKQGLTSKTTVETTAPAPAPAPPGGSLKEDEAQLRRRIAADPQAFFAQADTNQDGSLDRDEWAQACESVLGHAAPDLAKALFDQMDLDKDGTVSREEFVEMRNAIRLFVSGANTQGLLVEMLVGAVTAHLATTTPPHDTSVADNTSVADKTLDALVSLKETELHEAVAALSRAMREHGEQMRREREKRAKALTQLQLDEGEGKFANLPTAAYGTKDDFHKGLEVRRNGRDT